MKNFLLILLAISSYNTCLGQVRVVSPNGGEILTAGGAAEIVWEGVGVSELVEIEYSSDNGITWTMITDEAKGFKYIWRDIPRQPGNKYLIRIVKKEKDFFNNYKLEHVFDDFGVVTYFSKWSPDGKYLAIIDSNKYIRIYDSETNDLYWNFEEINGKRVNIDVIWSPDSKYITLIEHIKHGNLWILDLENRNVISQIPTGEDNSWDGKYFDWNHDGSGYIICSSSSDQVKFYNTETFTQYKTIKSTPLLFSDISIDWADNMQRIILYDWDTLKIIDYENGNIVKYINCSLFYSYFHNNRNNWFGSYYSFGNINLLSPDGNKIIAVKNDSLIGVYSTMDGELLYEFNTKLETHIYNDIFQWSSDSRLFSILKQNQEIEIRNSVDGRLINLLHFNNICNYELSPDGKKLMVMWIKYLNKNRYNTIIIDIYDLTVNRLVHSIEPHNPTNWGYSVTSTYWSPDSKKFATTSEDSTAKIWSLSFPEFQSDCSDNNWSIALAQATSKDIDMGVSLVGFTKDTSITNFIVNPGIVHNNIKKIYFKGKDKDQFSTNTSILDFDLFPGKSLAVDFLFKPCSTGVHTAEIIIVSLADTLRQTITGIGVLPEIALLNNFVDFGEVKLNKEKDSLVILLHNKSPQPVRIDSMKLTSYENDQFAIPYNFPFSIKTDVKKEILLRFSPTSVGKQACNLECYFDGPGSPTVTQLIGTGIFTPPEIQSGNITFESLICNPNAESTVSIANNGMEDLIVQDAEITGTNQGEFQIIPPFTQMTIPPGESGNIRIMFKPDGTGNRSANLVLKSNSYIDSVLTIPFSATKDSIALVPVITYIDLGYLCPGEYKDTSIIIRNEGTIGTSGFAEPTDGLSLINQEFVIDESDSELLAFRITGKQDEGKFTESITIKDSICSYSRQVDITGEVAKPLIDAEYINFVIQKGKTAEKQIKITNTGKRDAIISNSPVVEPPFSIIGNPFPLTIPAGESREITIGFTAADTIEVIWDIIINAGPCGISSTASLSGKGYQARVKLRAGYAESYAGDGIEIPVYLEEAQNTALAGANTLNTDIIFNSTVLSAQNSSFTKIDNVTASVTLKDLPLTGLAGSEIARLQFTAALGNAEYSPVYFSNIETDGGDVDFDTISGSFRLLGICRDGGDRLINSNGGVILSIMPNPASETLEIELGLWESGRTRLYLSDITGNEVKQLFDGNVTTYGKRKLATNINELAAGVYFVILKTPSGRQSAMIVKN